MTNIIDRDSFGYLLHQSSVEFLKSNLELEVNITAVQVVLESISHIHTLMRQITCEGELDVTVIVIKLSSEKILLDELFTLYESILDVIINLNNIDIQGINRFHLIWDVPPISNDIFISDMKVFNSYLSNQSINMKYQIISDLSTKLIGKGSKIFPKFLTEIISPAGLNYGLLLNSTYGIRGSGIRNPMAFSHIGDEAIIRKKSIATQYKLSEFLELSDIEA